MINSKEDYKRYINYEEAKMRKSYPNFTSEHKKILKFLKLYRKYEYYYNCKKNSIMTKILEYKYINLSLKYLINIPINTIEEGLCIIHLGPIYINNHSKIGKNLRIHPMTTIGKNLCWAKDEKNSCPIIKDGVWIGPGARLYGNITVGSNSVIGANSVVNKSVCDNTTVAGVPAKIINKKGYTDYFR